MAYHQQSHAVGMSVGASVGPVLDSVAQNGGTSAQIFPNSWGNAAEICASVGDLNVEQNAARIATNASASTSGRLGGLLLERGVTWVDQVPRTMYQDYGQGQAAFSTPFGSTLRAGEVLNQTQGTMNAIGGLGNQTQDNTFLLANQEELQAGYQLLAKARSEGVSMSQNVEFRVELEPRQPLVFSGKGQDVGT